MKRSTFAPRVKPLSGALRTANLPIPRTKKCAVCRAPFVPSPKAAKVCGPECAEKHAVMLRLKAERKADKARRESLKTRSDWIKETQIAFNAFIRERDRLAGYPCISSGKPLDWSGNNVDAGHYRSRGSAPHLRFDERNCHAQSKQDNRYGSGNAVDYRIGLIARIGLQAVETLESDQTSRNWTIEDLRAIRDLYRGKLKALKEAA